MTTLPRKPFLSGLSRLREQNRLLLPLHMPSLRYAPAIHTHVDVTSFFCPFWAGEEGGGSYFFAITPD